MAKNIDSGNRLDLDIGFVTKSPCRECFMKNNLPMCSKDCKILIQLQKLLVGIISCSNDFSEVEAYSLLQQDT